ncbi:MAG: hypothetical protein ACI388_05940 [Methanobrevibacter sp.]
MVLSSISRKTSEPVSLSMYGFWSFLAVSNNVDGVYPNSLCISLKTLS